jgi:hypothetical protein
MTPPRQLYSLTRGIIVNDRYCQTEKVLDQIRDTGIWQVSTAILLDKRYISRINAVANFSGTHWMYVLSLDPGLVLFCFVFSWFGHLGYALKHTQYGVFCDSPWLEE